MKVTKSRATLTAVLILLFVALISGAQSSTGDQGPAQETQTRSYWTDPSTTLMWAGKDNGKDVSWKGAAKYCRDLRLAGYSDWRLASLGELQGIYDKDANAPGLARLGGPAKGSVFTWHVKGNLFLTGNQWSSKQRTDDRGHPDGYAWYFDFNEGRPNDDPTGFPYGFTNRRALCVRGSRECSGTFNRLGRDCERVTGKEETGKNPAILNVCSPFGRKSAGSFEKCDRGEA